MTPIIAYRNPMEMWFWEGGWTYVLVAVVVVTALFLAWYAWEDHRKAKQRRKRRWMEMNDARSKEE
jgi:hypothetical protein